MNVYLLLLNLINIQNIKYETLAQLSSDASITVDIFNCSSYVLIQNSDFMEFRVIFSPLQEQPLYDVIQEGINRHFQGVCFRERNAGFDIDAHMKSPGFDNQIGIHPVTGTKI